MKNDKTTIIEPVDLIYSFVSISTFVLLTISKVTESLEKALNFNPTTSLIIILNMIVFISLVLYKKRQTLNHKKIVSKF